MLAALRKFYKRLRRRRRRVHWPSLSSRLLQSGVPLAVGFDYMELRNRTLGYLSTLRTGTSHCLYKFAACQSQDNLYCSVFACLTFGLLGQLDDMSATAKREWIGYFDAHQSPVDGLFYDPIIRTPAYDTSDWWGARHLSLLILGAYMNLGGRPKHRLKGLESFYEENAIKDWMESVPWNSAIEPVNDIDNKIMNIGGLLQFSRDILGDKEAVRAVRELVGHISLRVDHRTGMWGRYRLSEPSDVSRMVQFAYHLYCVLFYDGFDAFAPDQLARWTLSTQSSYGGFGVQANSSACEDIDSVYLLSRLSQPTNGPTQNALARALPWALANMNDDGGFVFRRDERLSYGHAVMSSEPNESNVFATWFRTLCLAYLTQSLRIPNGYVILRAPGYTA